MINDLDTFALLLESVHRLVQERLLPLEAQVAEEHMVPDDVVQELRGLGLFGLPIPREFGGIGLTVEEEIRVAMALGGASP